jgi:hypothetical protein
MKLSINYCEKILIEKHVKTLGSLAGHQHHRSNIDVESVRIDMSSMLDGPPGSAVSASSETGSEESGRNGSPGDGVCPPIRCLEEVCDNIYETWKISATKVSDDPFCKSAFL